MKLKKIASLMLAGIMAVSMLAGCKSASGNEEENSQIVPVTDVVTYANDALGADQKEALTYKASATLDGWIKDIATNKDNFTATDIQNANKTTSITGDHSKMTGKLTDKMKDANIIVTNSFNSLPADNASQSRGYVYVLGGVMDEAAAIKTGAQWFADATIGASKGCPETIESGKYNCEYSAEISALKVTNNSNDLSGESAWVIAFILTQDVSKTANAEV